MVSVVEATIHVNTPAYAYFINLLTPVASKLVIFTSERVNLQESIPSKQYWEKHDAINPPKNK